MTADATIVAAASTIPAPTILIVDPDTAFADATAEFARSHGFRPVLAHSLAQAGRMAPACRSELMLLNPTLPDGCGLDLLDELDLNRHTRIAVVTDHPSVDSATRAVSLPVSDYLVKPLCPERLEALLADASIRARALAAPCDQHALIGDSEAMRSVLADLGRIAPTTASVLIAGESGTGKELVARALHDQSGRKGPFVAVNCGAIAPELLASHLFGHERGSFTGAASRHTGFFEQANHGTLFLDEITEMSASLQVYLLRALETGRITRVGGLDEIACDARMVAATNRDPLEAIDRGLLREDLFYRLADFVVDLPPLRVRDRDVLLLAHCFIERLNREHGTTKRLAPDAERVLLQHQWPGNVRELRSVIQRAYILGKGDVVRVQPPNRRLTAMHQGAGTVVFNVGMSYAEVEHEMLMKTLERYGNDKTRAAQALGVSVRTIHNHLSRQRLQQPDMEEEAFLRTCVAAPKPAERARLTSVG
ncbi:MAG: sigma-54 dependent transcriptional regulator [Pseudomonadota bacterium]|nr:sigma-54 dependent transcriptional regulator [Pseudomonadota bacterium]